jgi:transcriptional regulator with XRE-family HTH domain
LPFYRWSLAVPRRIPGYPAALEHIGHHILRRRLDLGLEQKEAARQLGVHPGGLENWEYGRTTPADRFMARVIRFLGYNPAPEPTTLGASVAYERIARGWSRKQLAAHAGVDESTVGRIEEDAPRLARRPRLAVSTAFKSNPSPRHDGTARLAEPQRATHRTREGG